MEPQCAIESAWMQEPIKSQVTRVITRLHQETCLSSGQPKDLLLAPAFALIFPLLRSVIEDKVPGFSEDEDIKVQCLAIISAHAEMRETGEATGEIDEVNT